MRILLAPSNPRLGDIAANTVALRAARAEAAAQGAALLVTPEASLTGAPAADLASRPELLEAAEAALIALAAETADGGPGLLLGTVWREGAWLHSGIALLDGGRLLARRAWHAFPRGMEGCLMPGPAPGPVAFRGLRLGLMSGGDAGDPAVSETLEETGAELLLSLTATAFAGEAEDRASDAAVARVVETGLPFIGLNLLGSQGGRVFSGGGFALNPDRALVARLPGFAAATMLLELEAGSEGWRIEPQPLAALPPSAERLWQALVLGLADAAAKGGFPGVMLDPAEAAAPVLAAAARAAGLPVARPEGLPGIPASPGRDAALWQQAEKEGSLLLCGADALALALGEGGRAGHLAPLHDLWPSEVAGLAALLGLPALPVETEAEAILRGLLEQEARVDALAAEGYDPARIRHLWRAMGAAAYKRRQAPLALRLRRDRADPFSNGMTSLLP